MDMTRFNREKIPWKKLLRDAQNGDKKAMEQFCLRAEPIIQEFFKVSVLNRRLGGDEIRGIAYLALMQFMADFKGEVIEKTLPCLLFRVIRCALVSETRKERKRFENELQGSQMGNTGEAGEEDWYDSSFPANREAEPEQVLLKAELKKEVQAALLHTTQRQRNYIRAIYFDGKKTAEYAEETGCSPQFIRKTKQNALIRMRALLKHRNVV